MRLRRAVLALVLIVVIIVSVFSVSAVSYKGEEISSPRRTDISAKNWTDSDLLNNGQIISDLSEPFLLKSGESLNLEAVTAQGDRILVLEYKPQNPKVADCIVKISVDGEDFVGALPLLWTDSKNDYSVDRYGNELYPKQTCLEEFTVDVMENYSAQSKNDLILNLKAGTHKFVITANNQDILIRRVALAKKPNIPSYEEYRKNFKNKQSVKTVYTVEAEKYSVKSDSYIRSNAVKNAALVPYDTKSKKINVLDGATWDSAGQKVAWEVNVKEDGLYKLGFKYSLTNNAGKASYRSIEIDGKTPFKECEEVAVVSSGNSYKNFTFTSGNGTPYEFFLTKGTHLISMRVEMGIFDEIYTEIKDQMQEINEIGIMLQKLTAGVVDENRTWDMDEYMPGTVDKLLDFADNIRNIYKKLQKLSDSKASYASSLIYAAEALEKLVEEPEQIPNRTKLLSVGDSSASKYLGTALSSLTVHPITIDRIYIYNGQLPEASVSFIKSISEGFKSFIYSFLPDAGNGNYSATFEKTDDLQVWINRPVQYVQVLQQYLDETYNADNKTHINLSIMPSEQKLILANASGTNPDVALSVGYTIPFDFAIRGAAKNLLEYEDFLPTYAKNYNLEALVPLGFADGIYGAVESQDFHVMFYRKDTLEALNLKVPDTWDDVRQMMPELLRYSMNFCVPLASSGGSKTFTVTTPFLYQNKAEVYSEDGMSVEYGSTAAIEGFTQMTEIFNVYGAQQTVADFYNSFRYNSTPIGIGTFNTFLQLTVAAPELAGLWEIAQVPGVKQSDGSILRYQMADSTASMIFENTKKEKEAWDFLKWWLSTDTQLAYANNLQITFGPEYRWNTANLNAFSQLQYSDHDKEVILGQWKWQKETARHPATYMSERELSNAWINVVVNGDGIAEAVDKAVLQSNREILRKMQEFGYCDENGKVIKKYRQLTAADLYDMIKEEGANE